MSARITERPLVRPETSGEVVHEELLEHCAVILQQHARRMLRRFPGLRRWEETDDILQGTLLRLHRSLSRIQAGSIRHTFGLASEHIRRELIDLYRKHFGPQGIGANHASVGGSSGRSVADHQLSQIFDRGDGPGTWVAYQDWCGRIHEAVDDLPEREREVVSLRFYHGLGEAEIAEMQGVSVRTIRRRWRHARLLLHEALRGSEEDW